MERGAWERREGDLMGRFDLLWDGEGEPKLAEYNADTPTVLVEAAALMEVLGEELVGAAALLEVLAFFQHHSSFPRCKGCPT